MILAPMSQGNLFLPKVEVHSEELSKVTAIEPNYLKIRSVVGFLPTPN